MLTTLIRRELLDNLMTFRFAVAILIMLLLVVANTAVLIKDYERRLAAYNTALKTEDRRSQDLKTYSGGRLNVARPPNPLSIFNVGLDKRLGNEIWISHGFVPTLWDTGTYKLTNPLLNLFTSIDIVFIFEVVLSLIALIFAYDAIAGERERGTLRLVLTHPVRRGHILLAKYISAMLCLLVPLLISLLLAIILLTTSTVISLSTGDFLRIGGIILSSIVYLSVFYLIGMLISAVTRRTGTALMLAMFVWGFWVLVYPNAVLAAITPPETSQPRMVSAYEEIKQIWEAFDRERKQFLANDAFPGEDPDFGMVDVDPNWIWGSGHEYFHKDSSTLRYDYHAVSNIGKLSEASKPQVPHAQDYYRFLGPQMVNAAERAWLVRKQALEIIFVQPAIVDRILLRGSPVGMYDAATQAWVGTDLRGLRDFFEAARRYRRTLIDYYYDKNAFGAEQWFSADKGAVDWDSLPQFSFQTVDVATNAKRALPDVCILVMLNIILFVIIFLIFIKSEV
ncbi:ABC transporter permease subunit [Candidatus Poribacteria bacterium]|nr:ABC transporter permease subunit [Candidatus Poribacteria bacterium]MYG07144.1 ABC transporter permease subunit [Candidatus Poribacteria bacterium]MYK22350.1 ABC transporter permease subunit [Candidatus Poribacteria bacterium]